MNKFAMVIGYLVVIIIAIAIAGAVIVGLSEACKVLDNRYKSSVLQDKLVECEKISGGRPVKLSRLMLDEEAKGLPIICANCIITTTDGTEKILRIWLRDGVIPKTGELYIVKAAYIKDGWHPNFVLERADDAS